MALTAAVLAGADAATGGAGAEAAEPATGHLAPGDTLGDLLDLEALRGFAPLVLPWDGRDYDRVMPLGRMAALMPYHSEVRPDRSLAALNELADEARAGRQVFFPLYAERAPASGSSPETAGLFFLRGRPGAPFALIAPGGGFHYVGSLHEGFPYAQAIRRAGLNSFVLRYRPGQGGRVATEDMAAALAFILREADGLGVSRRGYSLWGSSAGARMAAAIGSHGTAAFGAAETPPPAAVVMAYTGHSDVGRREPDTFAVVGERDGIAPPARMERRVAALRRLGARVAFRIYPGLGHGFGPGEGTPAEGWLDDAIAFWRGSRAD